VDYDAERDQVLAARGVAILRVTNEDVSRDLSGVLARIAEAAEEARRAT
jgi:very-short-patch-repair endonuclease